MDATPPRLTVDLAAVFASTATGVLIFEAASGRVVHANDSCLGVAGLETTEVLLGLSGEEAERRFDFLNTRGERVVGEALRRVLAGGEREELDPVRFRRWNTGERRWGVITLNLLEELSRGGRLVALGIRDVTAQRRAEHALRIFTDASALLARSLDLDETMKAIVRMVVPELADGCTLELLDEDGTFRFATAQLDPERDRIARELRRRYPFRLDAPTGPGFIIRTGQPELVNTVTDEAVRTMMADEEHYRLFKQLGVRSGLGVPLKARGRTLGALSLSHNVSGRRFDEEDLALITELASRAALALDNARLYREAQVLLARKDEEVRLSEALRRIGTSLASELEPRALFQRIVAEATVLVGARVGAFSHRRGDGGGKVAYAAYAVVGAASSQLESGGIVPWPEDPLSVSPSGERGVRCDDVLTVPGMGPCPPFARSYLAVPVMSKAGEVLGGLFFVHPEIAYFTERHERLARDVAAQAAVALENARLFQQLREAEESTRRGDERLRLAMDAVKMGYFDQDLVTEQSVASPRFEAILGLKSGEQDGSTFTLLSRVHPEDRANMLKYTRRSVETGGTLDVTQFRVVDQDGGVRWVESHNHTFRNEAGKAVRRLGFVWDITARKEAEARERELARAQAAQEKAESARARTTAIIDGLDEPVLWLGEAGRVRFVNLPAERLLRVSREALLAAPSIRTVPLLQETPEVFERWKHAGTTATPARFEQLLADGRWYEVNAVPLDGGLLVSLHDITARRREQEAQARAARCEAVRADVSTALSTEGTRAAVLRRCADALVQHLGVSRALLWTVDARGILLLQAASGPEPVRAPSGVPVERLGLERVTRELVPVFLPDAREVSWAREGGPLALACYPLHLGGQLVGAMALLSQRPLPLDVLPTTRAIADAIAQGLERRSAEEELKRSNTELAQFAYVASHDLQEPLRTVSNYMALLQRRYRGQLDSDAHEFIGFAVDGAKRMKVLIDDLLAYSRVGTQGKPLVPTSCEEVLRGALETLSLAIEDAGAQVTSEPLPEVLGDEVQLDQLFRNLIANALKFRRGEPPRIHVSAREHGDEWILSVADNGIGIEAQYFERIFIIFQRLHGKDEYPGTGIGLAICKKIVERHGGRIWVDSTPGKGSTFSFTLKRSRAG